MHETQYVLLAEVSYHVLLGRPWLHKHHFIPSTYHQCIKGRLNGRPMRIRALFTRVPALAACQSQVSHESQPRVSASLHNLEHFFTLSHSLPLHESHLYTMLLIAKIQVNLAQNKANKIVDKIQPYNLEIPTYN